MAKKKESEAHVRSIDPAACEMLEIADTRMLQDLRYGAMPHYG
jgi:hypothetical protein